MIFVRWLVTKAAIARDCILEASPKPRHALRMNLKIRAETSQQRMGA
jgi:hypothetical protein